MKKVFAVSVLALALAVPAFSAPDNKAACKKACQVAEEKCKKDAKADKAKGAACATAKAACIKKCDK